MPAFGRIVQHDEKSRLYQAPQAHTQRSVLWPHDAPVLDQGNLGSCTGNALAQAINTDYFAKCRNRYLTEHDAVDLYSAATRVDDAPGVYPPTDTGSSGLAVCKAGVKAGYLSGYRHTFSFSAFTGALQLSPVIVGVNWYDDMMTPDKRGFVHPTGALAGGHEFLALGVNYELSILTFLNSWSDKWGIGGRFYMSFGDFASLLADRGDATVPLPVRS
jgi:hypothetical protein